MATAKCQWCGKTYQFKQLSERGLYCSIQCWSAYRSGHQPEVTYTRGRGGKRDDLDGLYVRSAWEANWARYLNWLVRCGAILKWEYEPDTFEFHGIKRGTRFYTPDFKVWELSGRVVYYEIKGWMDAGSATKLKRMKKYYPDVRIVLIGNKEYYSVARGVGLLIPGWERKQKERGAGKTLRKQ